MDVLFAHETKEYRDAIGEFTFLSRADAYIHHAGTFCSPRRKREISGIWICLPTASPKWSTCKHCWAPPQRILPGDFKHFIPDASSLAEKSSRHCRLLNFMLSFQTERDRTGDKIEFPLVELAGRVRCLLGTATIFMLTVYWFPVFRDFRLRLLPGDNPWNAPWIGISREFWSKRLLRIATTLLPPAAATCLILSECASWLDRTSTPRWRFCFGCNSSLQNMHSWLCINTWVLRVRLGPPVPHSPPRRRQDFRLTTWQKTTKVSASCPAPSRKLRLEAIEIAVDRGDGEHAAPALVFQQAIPARDIAVDPRLSSHFSA